MESHTNNTAGEPSIKKIFVEKKCDKSKVYGSKWFQERFYNGCSRFSQQKYQALNKNVKI